MAGKMDDDGVGTVCHFPNRFCQEEKSSDKNHVFQSEETGKYFFCLKDMSYLQ